MNYQISDIADYIYQKDLKDKIQSAIEKIIFNPKVEVSTEDFLIIDDWDIIYDNMYNPYMYIIDGKYIGILKEHKNCLMISEKTIDRIRNEIKKVV